MVHLPKTPCQHVPPQGVNHLKPEIVGFHVFSVCFPFGSQFPAKLYILNSLLGRTSYNP